jgi:hypothetical protein
MLLHKAYKKISYIYQKYKYSSCTVRTAYLLGSRVYIKFEKVVYHALTTKDRKSAQFRGENISFNCEVYN